MSEIRQYYADFSEEERLFDGKQHYCEYLVTMHLLRKYLSLNGMRILDCCAGTGAYSFALAAEGAEVTAGDLVAEHAEKMRRDPRADILEEIYTGDAGNLSRFKDASFDTVLCMGALYHLPDAADRDAVLRECIRVLKPGGFLICAWQRLLAICLARLLNAVHQTDAAARREAFSLLDDSRRTHCRDIFYGMTIDEIESIAPRYGLRRITNASTYPALYSLFTAAESFSPDEYSAYVRCIYETCEDAASIQYTMHGLYIAQKLPN